MLIIPPTYSQPEHFNADIRQKAYGVLKPDDTAAYAQTDLTELAALKPWWNDLPADQWLKDGGRYRRRRHSCFIVHADAVEQTPHRAHWQPTQYNALHGGFLRMFEPITPEMIALPAWGKLLRTIGHTCSAIKGEQPWYVEAPAFRIDTTHGIGRPTPEGAHRDGVDFVAILLVERQNISGGESRIFAADTSAGERFTLLDDWTLLLLDDERVIHESTPIQPVSAGGHRDTLVLTWRRYGFQEPSAA